VLGWNCAGVLIHDGLASPSDWPNVLSFRSRHPGGATFCFADGSVHFVSQTIEHAHYRALSTSVAARS
jgi:prepilin-type processing-associated H-X9-DG protein